MWLFCVRCHINSFPAKFLSFHVEVLNIFFLSRLLVCFIVQNELMKYHENMKNKFFFSSAVCQKINFPCDPSSSISVHPTSLHLVPYIAF